MSRLCICCLLKPKRGEKLSMIGTCWVVAYIYNICGYLRNIEALHELIYHLKYGSLICWFAKRKIKPARYCLIFVAAPLSSYTYQYNTVPIGLPIPVEDGFATVYITAAVDDEDEQERLQRIGRRPHQQNLSDFRFIIRALHLGSCDGVFQILGEKNHDGISLSRNSFISCAKVASPFKILYILFLSNNTNVREILIPALLTGNRRLTIVQEPLHGYDGSNKADRNGQDSCEQIVKFNTFQKTVKLENYIYIFTRMLFFSIFVPDQRGCELVRAMLRADNIYILRSKSIYEKIHFKINLLIVSFHREFKTSSTEELRVKNCRVDFDNNDTLCWKIIFIFTCMLFFSIFVDLQH
ncbi:hypothetical protein ACJX0J_010300 [Zea mays]